MGNFIGSTSVNVLGQDIDINDDVRMRDLLREHTRKLLAPMPPVAGKNLALEVLTDVQLVTTKLAFVLNQTALQGAAGVSTATLIQFYEQLAKIAGLTIEADPSPAILGMDGQAIEGEVVPDAVETPANDEYTGPLPAEVDEL